MKKWTFLLVAILLLLSVVVAGCGKKLVPKSSNVVEGVITVNAKDYYHVQFTVDTSTMRVITVSGSFTASGGSGNDVEVFVLSATNYINWKNGHNYSSLYSSGQVTTANFTVPITVSGDYYVVYSNIFWGTWGTRQVSTKVDLKWYELE